MRFAVLLLIPLLAACQATSGQTVDGDAVSSERPESGERRWPYKLEGNDVYTSRRPIQIQH